LTAIIDCSRQLSPSSVSGRVVEFVEKDDVATTHEPRNQTQVRLVSGREREARFLAEEHRQFALELLVQFQRSVQEPAARAPRTVPLERGFRRRKDFRMMREPQVVVGAHHEPLLSFDDDDGVFGIGERLNTDTAPSLELTRG
jgi:hypothetical protein